jgi:dehydrogenase/reductase SDR family protein 7
MIGGIIAVLIIALVAIFFASDADLPLVFLPNPPAKANAGQVVWIVGASSGIGATLALDYAKDGAKVIISARRVQQLEELAKKCVEAGGEEPLVLPMDSTNFDEHSGAFQKIVDTYGHLDVLVLNAGVSQRAAALDTDFSVTESIMKLNFFSYVALTKIVLPHFVSRNAGKIVVMSSVSGIMGTSVASTYSAAKFALVSVTVPYLPKSIVIFSSFLAWLFQCIA